MVRYMNRCLIAIGLAVLTSLTPSIVHANSPATVELYGIYSGFAKARLGPIEDRHSITVGVLPDELASDANYELLDNAMDSWNMAAGWEVFKPDFSGASTDVTFRINDDIMLDYGGWTDWLQFPTGWYEHCYVTFHSWGPPLDSTYAHELGHCLGFQDVPEGRDPYRGIMSYARTVLTMPDNEYDRASLEAVGYQVG